MKFDRYQFVRKDDSLEIVDCLLGTGIFFSPFAKGQSEKQYQFDNAFAEEYLAELNAYQDLTSTPKQEKHLGYVVGPRSETGIRINSYEEGSALDTQRQIRLAMLQRIPIGYEKDEEGHYQLLGKCDLDLQTLDKLIAELQAARRLLAGV